MCGIFQVIRQVSMDRKEIYMNALRMSHRGEDETHSIHGTCKSDNPDQKEWSYDLVFHRLALNGMSPESSQPLYYPVSDVQKPYIYLMCNGEIYNHLELEKKYNIKCNGDSDCEIIIHLYRKFGFKRMIDELRGVFAISLLDLKEMKYYVGRDPYGVRGLSIYYNPKLKLIGVASEVKALIKLDHQLESSYFDQVFKPISDFPPGTFCCMDLSENCKELPELNFVSYFSLEPVPFSNKTEAELLTLCKDKLIKAISTRLMCDRKTDDGKTSIGAFLSGGFDSSVIAAIGGKHVTKTFSIGFKGSPDLKNAKLVAEHIGSEHYECIVTVDEMLAIIPVVVKQLETYDTTTIRAGAFMYKLTKYIDTYHTDLAILLSGEGADEASGSYKYFEYAPDDIAFHNECHRLLKELTFFDARRGDRCTAGHNKEIRVPFLDRDFLDIYMSVPPKMKTQKGIEKYFLRKMVSQIPGLLPEAIIWRPKEAMSDGVSVREDSWYQIIQKHVKKHSILSNSSDLQLEKDWYMSLYLSSYPGCKHLIPHYWEPKWIDTIDPSARLLPNYK
uniref:asparagine synthase (glutamine-hydrolyzing) n=1 Tax=viral metagenome TaxID=1070528 RepID=A0A6C0J6N2_9ZZZZ